MLHKLYAKLDLLFSATVGTAVGTRDTLLNEKTMKPLYEFNVYQFAIDTSAHLVEGAIVAIGTYVAVHFFKKFWSPTKENI